MSLAPLKNPKHLSYSDLQSQIRELARRMNLLTQMEAVLVEPTAAPKFEFSNELAKLDVQNVAEVVEQLNDLAKAYDDSIEECETARQKETEELENAVENIQENFCSTQTGLKLANGLEDVTYFSTISGTVCIPDLTTGGCASVTASLILYRNSGGNWFIKYYSAGISSNLRWAVRGPQDSDGNYSPVLGFLDAGQTGTIGVGETDWIEVPLTIWGQYRFNPVPTTVSGGFGSFAAEDDLIECP